MWSLLAVTMCRISNCTPQICIMIMSTENWADYEYCTSAIPPPRRLNQEAGKFKTSLGCIDKLHIRINTMKNSAIKTMIKNLKRKSMSTWRLKVMWTYFQEWTSRFPSSQLGIQEKTSSQLVFGNLEACWRPACSTWKWSWGIGKLAWLGQLLRAHRELVVVLLWEDNTIFCWHAFHRHSFPLPLLCAGHTPKAKCGWVSGVTRGLCSMLGSHLVITFQNAPKA